MSIKEISAIAIKLLAISLMLNVIVYVPSVIITMNTMERMAERLHGAEFQPIFYVSVVGSFLFIGAISAFVLYKLANSVLKSLPDPSESEPINVSETFILQVAGVYFIVSALQAFPSLAIAFGSSDTEMIKNIGHFIGSSFELGIGLYLLISPKVWIHTFSRLRGRV